MLFYAVESLWRDRRRYVLFGGLFAVLGAAWLLSLLLGRAAETLRTDLIDEYGRTVVLEEIGSVSGSPDEALYARFCDPALVESLQYTGFTQANVYLAIFSAQKKDYGGITAYTGTERTVYDIVGYDYTTPYTPFTRRTDPYVLTAGRLPETDGECMIFDEAFDYLAKKGVLKAVGEEIRLNVYPIDEELAEGARFILQPPEPVKRRLTVVGIVSLASVDDHRFLHRASSFTNASGETVRGEYRKNVLFVTANEARQYPAIGSTALGVLGEDEGRLPKYDLVSRLDAVYTLHDFADLEAFRAQVQAYNRTLIEAELAAQAEEVGLDAVTKRDRARPSVPAYRARPYFDGFEALIEPLSTLGDFSAQMARNLTLLVATLLIILTVYDLYARTYEIGVLRCIGMSRLRITATLMLEHGLLLTAALTVGIGIAILAASTVIPALFAPDYRVYLIDAMAGLGGAIGQILLCGVCLTVLAALGGTVYIQRCHPLAILRNRS